MNNAISHYRSTSIALRSRTPAESSTVAPAAAGGILNKGLGKGRSFLLAAVAAVATLLGTTVANTAVASPIQLIDQNSSITINPTSPAGVDNWTVDGTNQLNQEWFWYNVGSSGGQFSIDTLGLTNSALYDSTGDGDNDTAVLTYGSSGGLQITITYSLSGGKTGSGRSDIGETFSISNGGSSQTTYHLFEYTNFNLGNSTSGQSVSLTGGNTATDQGNSTFSQVVVSPQPGQYDAGVYPNLLNMIDSTTSTVTALPDVATSTAGDGEWAFEWDITLNSGASYVASTDQQIVPEIPEPAGSLALLAASGLILSRPYRRNQNSALRKTAQLAEA